jgi:hypothetical protein
MGFRQGGGGGPVVGGGGRQGNQWAGGGGGRHYGGGYRHNYRRGGGGFWPGFAVGAGIGSTYGYYGSGYYGGPAYYDDSYGYYDDGVVAVAPPQGDDAVAYCMQKYKSYDPARGSYLGYDGKRHPCP